MKKFAVFILALLYLGTSSGASVNIHYCMGEYAGWDLGHTDDDECDNCGMEKSSGTATDCCKDEHKLVKVKDVHKSAQVYTELLQHAASLPVHTVPEFYSVHVPGTAQTYPVVNAPPAGSSSPVFILVRSIRL